MRRRHTVLGQELETRLFMRRPDPKAAVWRAERGRRTLLVDVDKRGALAAELQRASADPYPPLVSGYWRVDRDGVVTVQLYLGDGVAVTSSDGTGDPAAVQLQALLEPLADMGIGLATINPGSLTLYPMVHGDEPAVLVERIRSGVAYLESVANQIEATLRTAAR